MPRGLNPRARHAGGGLFRDVALLLALFAVGGGVAGLVWRWLWTPLEGTVLTGVWYPDTNASEFGGTGLYVLVGLVAGVVLGVVSALVTDRRELVVLALVLAASLLAAWVMLRVGEAGMPPDPDVVARTAADRTRVPGTLTVTGWTPLLSIPAGALAGLSTVFVGLARKASEPRTGVHQDG